MSPAVRAALAVFALGVLGVWLVKPIGDPCPDIGRLPAGSQSASSPSFAPPLTRTCTYTTADATKARQRYVPIVDWLIVAVVAGVVGAGVGLAGPGTPRPERTPKPARTPQPERTPKPQRTPNRSGSRERSGPRVRRGRPAPSVWRARPRHRLRSPHPRRRRAPRSAPPNVSASVRSARAAATAADASAVLGARRQRAQGTSTESSCGASRATTYSAASVSEGFSSRCVSRGGT